MEQAAQVARSAGLLPEATFAPRVAAGVLMIGGGPDRALPLATDSLTLASQLDMRWLVTRNKWLVAILDGADSRRVTALLTRRCSAQPWPVIEILPMCPSWSSPLPASATGTRFCALHPIRSEGFTGSVNAPTSPGSSISSPEPSPTSTPRQQRYSKVQPADWCPRRPYPRPVAAIDQTPAPAPSAAPSGGGRIIADLRRQTTAILRDALGDARLRELRSQGEAMDDDQIVVIALDAIARAQAALQP